MNALLVYPEIPDTFWSFRYALRFVGRKSAFPPLGLLTVAAMLPDSWDLRLADLNVKRLRQRDLAWADCVLISAMAIQRRSVHALVARCQEAGVTTIAGGPLFTNEPDAFPEIDHLVLNEAEATLPRFLEDFANGKAAPRYAATEFPSLDATPIPRWELADLQCYGSMNVQYSRGCPFDCDFCNITSLFGRQPRVKQPDQIIAELDSLRDNGWYGSVFFVDDNFIGNKKRLKDDLLPALVTWQSSHRHQPFNTEVSINLADDQELMALMAAAGFDTVFVGIETPDEAGLKECGKTQNRNRDLVADVKRIQHAGMQVQGGFILGFDGDTPSIFQRQIDFIQESGIVTAMVGLLEAIPGTRLHERLQREQRLVAGDTSGDNADATTNIIPRMNLAVLQDGYKRVMNQLYTPKHYYRRVLTFLREYKPPRVEGSYSFRRLLAAGRACFRLGVLGRERFQYWRLMTWTLLHQPSKLPVAVTLSIYGYHFRKVCEHHLR